MYIFTNFSNFYFAYCELIKILFFLQDRIFNFLAIKTFKYITRIQEHQQWGQVQAVDLAFLGHYAV